MFRDRKQDPDQPTKFVWDPGQAGDAPAHEPGGEGGAPAPGPRSARPRPGRALVAVAVIVPLAGGVAGLVALEGRHPDTVTATDAARVTSRPVASTVAPSPSGSPSPSLSPSRSRSPSKAPSKTKAASSPAAPEKQVTVVKTVAAPAAPYVAPATKTTTAAAAASPTATGPQLIGYWPLNHTADDEAGGHSSYAYNVAWDGAAAVFTGDASDSYVATSGPVLNTAAGASFTVSAWVYLTALPTAPQYDSTAVSQDAGTDSGFYLQYTTPCKCWAFSRVGTDTDDPTVADRATAANPQLDVWTHLVGVYNGSSQTLSLYVGGTLEGTAPDTTPFASHGSLAIGRGFYNGEQSDGFHGLVGDVRVYQAALSSSQVAAIG